MKNKGFTLIELLAVIVILAIIALIATPIILGIITDARKQANMRSAELYIVAVKQSIARKSLTTDITNTTCTVQSNGNISCTGVSGELEVQMSGNKATEGTIVIERGDVVDVQNLKVNNITYKYDNTRTLVEGTSLEPTPFTGTIYRNSEERISIGDSIESLTSYETEATKSSITQNYYLKHDVENNIITASYTCIRYTDSVTNELVEACLQGRDTSYYGTYDEMPDEMSDECLYDVSDKNPTGNIKVLSDIKTSFERSFKNGECAFGSSNSNCYSDSLGLSSFSSGRNYAMYSNSMCYVNSLGSSYCD